MTDQQTIERQTTALLGAVAPNRAPDRLYADVLTSIGRTRQRTRWLAFLKESPMRTPSGVAVGSPTFRLVTISMLTLALILVGAAALAAGASLLPREAVPPPYGVAGNGSIALHKDGDIWITGPSGEDPRLLIGGASDDHDPLYSHDGQRFVFERRSVGEPTQVVIANADGSGVTSIAEVPGDWWWADWSPDDSRMVVTWAVNGEPAIAILTTDGSQPPMTLDLGAVRPLDFAEWRPQDGREIIFNGYNADDQRAVFAATLDGTTPRQIGAASTQPESFHGPSLSPEGQTIAYWAFLPDTECASCMFIRDLDSGVETALSLDPSFPGVGIDPRFTPDGQSLLFESAPHDPAFLKLSNPGQDVIAPLDGSAPAKPLGPGYSDSQFSVLSPDGTQVLQDRGANGTWIIDIASGQETALPDGLARPTWQRLAP